MSADEPYPAEILAIQRRPYGLKGFRRFAELLGLKIHPFQAFMLAFYFAGVTELVILISKKNGKTTLLAALALYHLLKTPNAECLIGASSRDQATILFNQAARLVADAGLERIPLPRQQREATRYAGVFEVRTGYRVIKFEQGRIRVLAADADTADGVIPTLAIVDELHRHPSGALYGVFRDGLVGDAQMITISTAGASMNSPLGELLTKAQEFALDKVKRRRVYTSPDRSFVLVEWALDAEDDPHDIKAVWSVNPAPWHTMEALRRRHDSPSMTTGQWLRFACGIWTEGEEPEILPSEWDPLRVDIGVLEDGDEVWLAPSAGDNAAIGIASLRPDDRVAVAAMLFHRREGHSLLVDVENACLELAQRYDVVGLVDPGRAFERSGDLLEQEGLPRINAVWSPPRKMAATGTFLRMIRDGSLMHDGDKALREHVLKVTLKVSGGEEYMDVNAYDRAAVAVAMAVHHAVANGPTSDLGMILPSAVG